jgi:trimeric autotransporter adhesin
VTFFNAKICGRQAKKQRWRASRPMAFENFRGLRFEALEDRALLSVALAGVQVASAAQQQTLASQPAATQQTISSAIGLDQTAYHVASATSGVSLANPANAFTAELQLQSGALKIASGSDTWDMALVGLAYGGAVQPVGTAHISVNGNRVDINYGAIDEWYVNGPSGLEQGFTFPSLPQADASGALTVVLALGGDLIGTVYASGGGLSLTQREGPEVLCYTGLAASDATGVPLPAALQVQSIGGSQELLIQVNAAGAHGLITIDPMVEQAKLTGSDGAAGDHFGESVSVSGNTMVVGADLATIGNNALQGAAYVFTESGYAWVQAAKLTASDSAASSAFGFSVSISGNTVVVGAPFATVGGNIAQGAAYVFTEPASGWASMTQTAKLTASDGATYDQFGKSVSISGSTVVVGTSKSGSEQGSAYVFTESAEGWASMTQTAELTASNGAATAAFGNSVSISGNTVVVGMGFSGNIDFSGPGAA